MKGTSTVVFDRDRLNTNLVDIAFHLDAVVELISAAGALFDEERYDLPAGGHYLLGTIARDATSAVKAFEDLRAQITGIRPGDVSLDAALASLSKSAEVAL